MRGLEHVSYRRSLAGRVVHAGLECGFFIEVSYPDAQATTHLTFELMAEEFRKIGHTDLSVHVYHVKARFRNLIEVELRQFPI